MGFIRTHYFFYLRLLQMNKTNYKLIIWDFDGVIADSEKVWIENRKNFFHDRLGVDWDFDEVNRLFGGQADKTKRETLAKMGYPTDDQFWEDALAMDMGNQMYVVNVATAEDREAFIQFVQERA